MTAMKDPEPIGRSPTPERISTQPIEHQIACPVFRDPENYLAQREPGGISGLFKKRRERRALGRCLSSLQLPGKSTLLDVPCGPGRLYSYFQDQHFQVTGADLSNEMLGAASQFRVEIELSGIECYADAFKLPWQEAAFDVVVCTRFAYYFDHESRVALLAELSRVASSGIVVQLKTSRSLQSRLRTLRGKPASRNGRLFLLGKEEIEAEFARAGMEIRLIAGHGRFSDRVFVAARQTPGPGSL